MSENEKNNKKNYLMHSLEGNTKGKNTAKSVAEIMKNKTVSQSNQKKKEGE